MRYQWFQNKSSFKGFDTNGIELNLETLKVIQLEESKQFWLTVKDSKYFIKYIVKCMRKDGKKLSRFAVSIKNNSVFLIRINSDNKYDDSLIYSKRDFLKACTVVSRMLKNTA